jgi:hypothetical protein
MALNNLPLELMTELNKLLHGVDDIYETSETVTLNQNCCSMGDILKADITHDNCLQLSNNDEDFIHICDISGFVVELLKFLQAYKDGKITDGGFTNDETTT